MRQRRIELTQKICAGGRFEHRLLLLHREVQERRDAVRQDDRVLFQPQRLNHLSNTRRLNQFGKLDELVGESPVQGVNIRPGIRYGWHLARSHQEQGLALFDFEQDHPFDPLDESLQPPLRVPTDLLDDRKGADREKVLQRRLLVFGVPLSHDNDQLFLGFHRRFDCRHRTVAGNGQGNHHTRKQHGSFDREHGKSAYGCIVHHVLQSMS